MELPRITIDRNVIFAAEKEEDCTEAARELFRLHNDQTIQICISSANLVENNKEGKDIVPEGEWLAYCERIGLIKPQMLDYPFCWEMGSWGHTSATEEGWALEEEIHAILSPQEPLDLCAELQDPKTQRKVRNAKGDVFALWSHIWYDNDYFVTIDGGFHRNLERINAMTSSKLARPVKMMRPDEMVFLLINL
ncbi:hypothetical protein [Chitinimonas lacunae]|uniref:PIN domain-containing protein n=1 Tax=Chitinimonas lacunae TaxID=1963018 RepID=A0ABV8MMR1_9NEIS